MSWCSSEGGDGSGLQVQACCPKESVLQVAIGLVAGWLLCLRKDESRFRLLQLFASLRN
jgi:hypothetical protein